MEDNNNDKINMEQLAETGWQQMHEMLRERGLSADVRVFPSPVRKRKLFPLIAACLLFLMIFSYPFILNDKQHFAFNIANNSNSLFAEKTNINQEEAINTSGKQPVLSERQKYLLHKKLNEDYLKFKKSNDLQLLQASQQLLRKKIHLEKISQTPPPQCCDHIDTTINLNRSLPPVQKSNASFSKKVQVFAGAGVNIASGNTISKSFNPGGLNIHPGITVIVPFTNKLSLHTGLWAFSTVHGKEVSAKEKELVNNQNNNLYYNINTTSIIKASYFDVPVTLHYSINKNWSVGSGLQLSKLYKINIKEKKESFDYNNQLFSATVDQYNSTPARAAVVFPKKVVIKKFEPRFVAETNFQKGQWLFSAGYYYGLGKTITLKEADNTSHEYRNEYFKLGIQYRITKK